MLSPHSPQAPAPPAFLPLRPTCAVGHVDTTVLSVTRRCAPAVSVAGTYVVLAVVTDTVASVHAGPRLVLPT